LEPTVQLTLDALQPLLGALQTCVDVPLQLVSDLVQTSRRGDVDLVMTDGGWRHGRRPSLVAYRPSRRRRQTGVLGDYVHGAVGRCFETSRRA